MMWRLVFRKVATLTELETTWSYDDMCRASAILDQQDYIANKEHEKQKNQQRGR